MKHSPVPIQRSPWDLWGKDALSKGLLPKGPRDSFPKESFGLEDAFPRESFGLALERYGPLDMTNL